MLKYLLMFMFVSIISCCYAQQSKSQDIRNLMNLIEIEPTMRNMVEQGIIYFQKQKPNVPSNVWADVKSSIDYAPYNSRVEQIFDTHYSRIEIRQLINEVTNNRGRLPKFKQIVQQQLYDTGKEFGGKYANFITQYLTQHGY